MTESRFASLDALRGIAAVSVVLWHAAITWPGYIDTDPLPGWAWFIRQTPLHAAWAGPQAVVLFFVISGFVLALPFVSGRVPVAGFLVRRVLRLYPAYLVALGVALALTTTHSVHVPGTSDWFARIGEPSPSADLVVSQASMVGSVLPGAYNPVLWSLVVEMRVSIVFPFLVWLVFRYPWWLATGLATFLLVVNTELGLGADEVQTTRWLVFFVAGMLLARHRPAVVAAWRRLPGTGRGLLFGLAIVLYSAHYLWPSTNASRVTLDLLLVGAGSTLLVVGVMAETRLERSLAAPPLQLLGRLSYSLYLLHAVVLVAAIRVLAGAVAPPVAEAIGLALVLPVAMLCHRYVERPGIRVGRTLSGVLERRSRQRVAAADPVAAR